MDGGSYVALLALVAFFTSFLWIELFNFSQKNKIELESIVLWKPSEHVNTIKIIESRTLAAGLLRFYYQQVEYTGTRAALYAVGILVFVILPTFLVHLFGDELKAIIALPHLNYLSIGQIVVMILLVIITGLIYRAVQQTQRRLNDLRAALSSEEVSK